MERINEAAAARSFIEELKTGKIPLERSTNNGVIYSIEKEDLDTEAVRAFTRSKLFEDIKNMS